MKSFKNLFVLIAFITVSAIRAQITVNAVVNHATPTSTANVGNINLTVSGGTAPYTYTWTPGGATSMNLTGVARNDYSVTVVDALGASIVYPYSLGYKTNWEDIGSLIFRNDSLIQGYAISKNTLLPSTDGWAEVIVQSNTGQFHLGFSDSLSLSPNFYDVDFGFVLSGVTLFLHTNAYYGVIAYTAVGDVLRIERVGTTFNLKQNGNVIYTGTMSATKPYKLHATILTNEPLVNIGASFIDSTGITFPNYVRDYAFIKHCIPGSNNGSINLTPRIGGTTHTYTWSPGGSTANSITSLSVSPYQADVKDPDLNKSTQFYNVGYKTNWRDISGLIFRNDSIIQGVGISKNTLLANADGWAEVVLSSPTSVFHFGFSDSLSTYSNFYDVDFGFYVSGTYIYYHSNSYFGVVAYLSVGDILRIERKDSTFYLKQNNQIIISDVISKTKNFKLYAGQYVESQSNIGASFKDSTGISFPNYLRDFAVIRHCTPGQSDGSISLTPTIPSEIHSYTVNPGGYTSSPALGLAYGIYTITTQDADSNVNFQYFNVDYKVSYTNLNGIIQRNDSLIPTGPDYTTVSKNTLKAGVDGWSEMMFNGSDNTYIHGFTDSLSTLANTYADVDFGFYKISNTYIYGIYQGNITYLLALFPGKHDLYRIERKDTMFYLKANDVILYSGVMPKNKNYKLKTYIPYYYDTLCNVGANFLDSSYINFPGYVRNIPFIKHSGGLNTNDGSIVLSPKYSDSTFTYEWENNSITTNGIYNEENGRYKATIYDKLLNQSTYYYDILFKAKWASLDSCRSRNDSLLTPGSGSYSNWSTAVSKNTLKANTDGEFSWIIDKTTSSRMLGFVDTASTIAADYSDIDQGIYEYFGNLYYITNGSYYLIYSASIGDIMKIRRTADTVNFYLNDLAIYSTTVTNSNVDWKVKSVIYPDNWYTNIGCSFNTNFTAGIQKEHADYLNPINGSATVTPMGGVIPYRSVWSDGVIASSRTDLIPGKYLVVTYKDSTSESEVVGHVVKIGTKPYWRIKRNSDSNLDSIWTYRSDSLGILVGENLTNINTPADFELKVNDLNQNIAFGFLGSSINFVDSISIDTIVPIKINLAYSFVRKAVNDSIPVTIDSLIDLNSDYDDIHLVRINNRQIQVLLRGFDLHKVFSYSLGDFIKIGRDGNDGKIYIARNDTVIYRHNSNVNSEYFLPVSFAAATAKIRPKGIISIPIDDGFITITPISRAPKTYAKLKRKIDGGYYLANGGIVYFKYDGEYKNGPALNYKIYNPNHTPVIGCTSTASLYNYGDNRFYISLPSCLTLSNKYYVLEVTNEKNEQFYLKFKY